MCCSVAGDTCQLISDPCFSQPCRNGGTCFSNRDKNTFTCQCPSQFTGLVCDVLVYSSAVPSLRTSQGLLAIKDMTPLKFSTEDSLSIPMEQAFQPSKDFLTSAQLLSDEQFSDLTQNFKILKFFNSTSTPDGTTAMSETPTLGSLLQDSSLAPIFTSLLDFNSSTTVPKVLDFCSSNPCANGGTCLRNSGIPFCQCMVGFSGMTCSTEVQVVESDPCHSSPCHLGSTCIVGNTNSFSCLCSGNFTGDLCSEILSSDSSSNIPSVQQPPSVEHNSNVSEFYFTDRMVNSSSITTASSKDLFSRFVDVILREDGHDVYDKTISTLHKQTTLFSRTSSVEDLSAEIMKQSEQSVVNVTISGLPYASDSGSPGDSDFCASHPCTNGGSCMKVNGSYQCVCPEGFTGSRCGVDEDSCGSTVCLNGGTCLDWIDGFACQCLTGFTGKFLFLGVI